ncbi:class I SAM-dependent methyltransferase [Mycolicibacterium smegmatis]|uniref:class I SAM-dependent methyltransferase n=1 Tax=Mycolicibacterium smegmatis TaxID=1772 RepID=UPI0005D7CD71|nr:class I SAM-dependent methyltransferase [Mycolicibacterium smegmatis]MDF1900006.1 class I SAM-dependent methyltransferase [Mycolicibacterium smegmatis]MDF1906558.1 class I SAM-dependent methyltransferase [Mycolicibacterium smegmatis]MDF1919061.1 class I SAM-dependent methyltransferase [Mycolicibacterium smegmatis]MDF1924676.1 class I SAM-dependent methyltransferase [Mycolicibacterium smegmatis]UAK54180.1 class I SAM-dependent methyltransferase [Mycolicibacterium smegmatis]
MDTTPTRELFDQAYESRTAPWVIGEPQPAVIELERAGSIRSQVLDVGCGAGEHTILLTRLGYDVLGIDFSPQAIEMARENATRQAVDARFAVGDAMALGDLGDGAYDTILDSALFHIFDDADRRTYVASLHAGCRPGGTVHILALSDAGRGFGPEVSEEQIRQAFGDGWELEALATTTYRGVVGPAHAEAIGLPVDTQVDEPAWLARARRL